MLMKMVKGRTRTDLSMMRFLHLADVRDGATSSKWKFKANTSSSKAKTKKQPGELSETRFAAPRILAFREGGSEGRDLVSRLIPAHKDPPYKQEGRFPQLRSLTVEQRTKLKSSFIQFDDPSFLDWMQSLKVGAPEPS